MSLTALLATSLAAIEPVSVIPDVTVHGAVAILACGNRTLKPGVLVLCMCILRNRWPFVNRVGLKLSRMSNSLPPIDIVGVPTAVLTRGLLERSVKSVNRTLKSLAVSEFVECSLFRQANVSAIVRVESGSLRVSSRYVVRMSRKVFEASLCIGVTVEIRWYTPPLRSGGILGGVRLGLAASEVACE